MLKRHLEELKRITNSIPKKYLSALVVEKELTPVIRSMVAKASVDEDISSVKRERFKHLLQSGLLDKKKPEVDTNVEKKIDAYVEEEIARAVRLGRLPDPKTDPQFHLFNKKKQKWIRKHINKNK